VELIALVWVLSLVFSWAIPVASGMTIHLLVDVLYSHGSNPLAMSLVFRWRNHFRLDKICPDIDFK
jgi:hypothetical protein